MGVVQTDQAFVVETYNAKSGSIVSNEGYSFQGWNTQRDGGGTAVTPGAAYKPGADVTLYAQWQKNETPVRVVVYTWRDVSKPEGSQYDYTVGFTEPGCSTVYTDKEENTVYFTQDGSIGTLTVTAPNLFIYPGNSAGEKFTVVKDGVESDYTYDNDYKDFSTDVLTKEISFRIGRFKTLYVHKMPAGQQLQINGKYHSKAGNYGDGGTLFGGHKYKIHWYDDYTFQFSNKTHNKSKAFSYTYNDDDRCFVNVAHKGTATQHEMHVWIGYAYDLDYEIPRYSSLSTYNVGDYVVMNRNDENQNRASPYDYAIVWRSRSSGNKGNTPANNSGYWYQCNGKTNDHVYDNIYVRDYGNRDSKGPFQAISAVDQVDLQLTRLAQSQYDNSPRTLENYYPSLLSGDTVLGNGNIKASDTYCVFDQSSTIIDLSLQPRNRMFYIGFGVQDDSSGCTGIKFRGTYRISLIS